MSLDIEEAQVAIDFFDDEDGFFWHHRLLLQRLDGARWVVATPTLDIETVDLSQHRVVPIGRNVASFPDRIADELFAFDAEIDPNDLARIRGQARELAAVLGAPADAVAAVPGDAEWLFADTALANFGETVPNNVMSSADTSVVREAAGLARVDIDGELTWVHVARVLQRDLPEWRQEKQSGPGRDPRLAGLKVDATGRRSCTIREMVPLYATAAKPPDWPFGDSPHAALELATGIIAGGTEASMFHNIWQPRSGVSERSAVAIEHSTDLMIFHLMVTYDQYNMANSAAGELLARNILRIQRAVRRNPRTPDFSGLDGMTRQAFDETGGIVCSEFDRHYAESQRTQAQVMKQSRLWREEQEADDKRRRGGDKGDRDKDKKEGK